MPPVGPPPPQPLRKGGGSPRASISPGKSSRSRVTGHDGAHERRVVSSADRVPNGRRGEIDLRRILIHMIEEKARHNGHADLIRELIDGEIGD